MKKHILNLVGVLIFLLGSSLITSAQNGPNGHNPNSVRSSKKLKAIFSKPILEADIMYRTTVWRKINLKEKQNAPFFAIDREITEVILNGVKTKKLQPYEYPPSPTNNGVSRPMTYEDFLDKLAYYDDSISDTVAFRASDLYLMELKEEVIFDRRTSRMHHDIQSITLIVPQGTTPSSQMGDLRLATFKCKDLYVYFKETYEKSQQKGTIEDVRACWYNPANPRRHMSLADALELRLFSSRITKVSNPADDNLITIVNNEYKNQPKQNGRKVLYQSQTIQYNLMEYEHHLWEY